MSFTCYDDMIPAQSAQAAVVVPVPNEMGGGRQQPPAEQLPVSAQPPASDMLSLLALVLASSSPGLGLASHQTRALATLAASALTSRPATVAAIKCFKDLQGIEVAEENRVIAQFEVTMYSNVMSNRLQFQICYQEFNCGLQRNVLNCVKETKEVDGVLITTRDCGTE